MNRLDALERKEDIADFPFKKFRDFYSEKMSSPRLKIYLPISVPSMEESRLTSKVNEET